MGPMKMRAAVLEEFGRPLAVQEVELAEPRRHPLLAPVRRVFSRRLIG
jgi:Zn-dependent alcohol dehydrogenase